MSRREFNIGANGVYAKPAEIHFYVVILAVHDDIRIDGVFVAIIAKE